MLDTQYLVETPEGVAVALNLAGPYARVWAFLIDLLLRGVIYVLLWVGSAFLFALSSKAMTMGLLSIVTFLVEWFYPVFFEMNMQGQTPGKRALKLRVVHSDGTPINWSSSIIRNFLRVADFLPFLWLAGLLVMSSNPRFQRLGDIAADTVVTYTPKKLHPPVNSNQEATPPPLRLTSAEQRAICDFAERSQQFSKARAIELAEHAKPLTQLENEKAVNALKAYAAWIQRGRG
ncbi:MAG TPA: RDD family protein [Pseudomonadales bacterium]|nr:RDD family protein [Pseudomonadales bacterium]